jgi:hypothetical protein
MTDSSGRETGTAASANLSIARGDVTGTNGDAGNGVGRVIRASASVILGAANERSDSTSNAFASRAVRWRVWNSFDSVAGIEAWS